MKTLEFNGQNISYRYIDGAYWIALKPICEALNVDYIQQFKNAKSHPIFSELLCNHTMVDRGGKARQMVCLPEELIYGWLFSINSSSPDLLAYQKECNHLLYLHFRGMVTKRSELYSELSKEKAYTEQLEQQLRQGEMFQQWEASRMRAARLWKNLKTTASDDPDMFR